MHPVKKGEITGSWAIWADRGVRPLDNVGDLSVFDFEKNRENRHYLHANFVIVGLNISSARPECKEPDFKNFHSASPKAKDYKMRDAFIGTPLWGAYMTDILKDFPEVNSGLVAEQIRDNPEILLEHFDKFDRELSLLGANDATLIAMGGLTANILRRRYRKEKIIQLIHYSYWMSPITYVARGRQTLQERGVI